MGSLPTPHRKSSPPAHHTWAFNVCPHLPAQLGMNPVFLSILFLINQALIGGVVNGLCCSVTEELQIFDLIYSMDSAGDLSASLDIQSPDRKDGQV